MIIITAVLTLALETLFFILLGRRNREFILTVILINVITNILLNLLLYFSGDYADIAVYPLEAAAIAAEYFVYAALEGHSFRLFLQTLAANSLSYITGLVLIMLQ